ncbi:MAG TPA: sensor histidine kinase [Streptosporangiaceae bacterium]|nr:sensor histidine kinase [Streptosporangiaceae bacterium]
MTSPQPADPATAAPETLHAAAVYDSDQDLRSSILAYLIDGISRREKVVVIVPQHTGEVLGAALGSGAMMVQWGLPSLSYEHLGRATETIRGYLADRRAAGHPTRLLTENDVNGGIRGPGRLAGYLRAESAADGLYGSHGFPCVCLYDRRRYSPGVLADVERVHPHVLDDKGQSFSNQDYVNPAAYLAAHPGPVSVVPNEVPLDLELADLNDLGDIRHQVGEAARGLRLDPTDATLAEVAAGEVIANAFRHGVPPGRVRVWRDADAVLVRVDSSGPGPAVAVSGFEPPDLAAGAGAGMWVVRQIADVVHVETRRDGTTVEMQFPL